MTTIRYSRCKLETHTLAAYQPDGKRLSLQEIADQLKPRRKLGGCSPVILSDAPPDGLMATVLASNCIVIVVPDGGLKFNPSFPTSPMGQDLLDAFDLAFTQRLQEYEAGLSRPEHAIRLNKKLYDEQISAAHDETRRLVTENYVERAKQIESIAKHSLKNGTGLSQPFLESKAARISAALELSQF